MEADHRAEVLHYRKLNARGYPCKVIANRTFPDAQMILPRMITEAPSMRPWQGREPPRSDAHAAYYEATDIFTIGVCSPAKSYHLASLPSISIRTIGSIVRTTIIAAIIGPAINANACVGSEERLGVRRAGLAHVDAKHHGHHHYEQ
jgi:hypothetical protein